MANAIVVIPRNKAALTKTVMNEVALLIIDVQKGFDDPSWGHRNNPDAEEKIAQLLTHWRSHSRPIIHIRHCSVEPNSPLRSNQPGNTFKEVVKPLPREPEFTKTVNSAFIGTELEQYLRNQAILQLVVVGLTTDHCVSTSVRMAGNLGFHVTVVSDATATFDRTDHRGIHYSADAIHNIHLASLNGEFCTVQTTEQVLGECAPSKG